MIRSTTEKDKILVAEYNLLEKKWNLLDGVVGAMPKIEKIWEQQKGIEKELGIDTAEGWDKKYKNQT